MPLLADGVGIVSSTGGSAAAKSWLNKRVVLNPGTGWKDSLDGPEHPKGYAILGGTKTNPAGTLADVVTLDAGELEECPPHLSDEEAAALPLQRALCLNAPRKGLFQPGREMALAVRGIPAIWSSDSTQPTCKPTGTRGRDDC